MENFYIYSVLSLCFFALAIFPLVQRYRKIKYYESLPKGLKNEEGKFIIDKKITEVIEKVNAKLIQTARSEFPNDRSPARTLENKEAARYIEKFAYFYFDDFTDEISDGMLDWNNENTELFFELMRKKYGITNRSLLKTILHLRNEIKYFNFRDSMIKHRPASQEELLKKTIVYEETNEDEVVTKYEIKRLSCELGFGVPYVPLAIAQRRAKLSLELESFDRDFCKGDEKIKETSKERMRRTSWEEIVKMAFEEGIQIAKEFYLIAPQDFGRDNRLDRYFKKHLKFALIDHFEGECADCGVSGADAKLHLDHFWMPKSKGGNFAMRSKDGHYVNNCVPLCRSCNSSKGAKGVYEHFTPERVKGLLEKSHEFDAHLNIHLKSFDDHHFNLVPIETEFKALGKKAA